MITKERMEEALMFLSSTDEECADLRAKMERAEYKARAVRDAVFRHVEGTVADRTAQAGCSDEYMTAMNEYFDLLRMYEAMRNRRATETIVIEAWRSINANRRQAA